MALKLVSIYPKHGSVIQVKAAEDYDLQPGYVRYKSTEDMWIVLPLSEIVKIEEVS